MGHRKDICHINGEISFRVSDLYPGENQRPLFAQMYLIDPEVATSARQKILCDKHQVNIRDEVLQFLDHIIRTYHPFAKSYKSADELFKKRTVENISRGKEVPDFRVRNVIYMREIYWFYFYLIVGHFDK